MSHVGFADSYDPPDPAFDVEAAMDSADNATRLYAIKALDDAERFAEEWNEEYGHNEGKLGACEANPWLPLLLEAFYVVEYFYPQRIDELREKRRKLGV